jgi:hypothetical protein
LLTSLQPPTDNLYKFIAISSLALGVVVIISLEWAVRADGLRAIDVKRQIRVLEIEMQELAEQSKELAEEVQTAVGAARAGRNTDAAAKALRDRTAEIRALTKQHQIKTVEVRSAQETLTMLLGHTQRYRRYTAIGYPLVALLATVGFVLWYVQLQQYQDAAAKLLAQTAPGSDAPGAPSPSPDPSQET